MRASTGQPNYLRQHKSACIYMLSTCDPNVSLYKTVYLLASYWTAICNLMLYLFYVHTHTQINTEIVNCIVLSLIAAINIYALVSKLK